MNDRRQKTQSLSERTRLGYERSESHPFRVGETYANRNGAYEVMQIAPPKMTIRYADGGQVVADIAILARIWENLHLPPERLEMDPRERSPRRPAAPPRTPRAGPRS